MNADNVRRETVTASSRILNRSSDVSSDNNLGHSLSDSGALRAHDSAPSGSESSTNPTTSPGLVDTPLSNARKLAQILESARGRLSLSLGRVAAESVFGLLEKIQAQLVAEEVRRREVRELLDRRRAAALADAALVDRTNRELSGDPSVLLEEGTSPAGSGE